MATKKAYHGWAPVDAAEPALTGGAVIPQPRLGPFDLPWSDGLPMADSDAQARTMMYSWDALEAHFGFRDDIYIAIDTFFYWRDPKSGELNKLAPDVAVVLGVSGHLRTSYRVWEEGDRVPDFVLEVISPKSVPNDLVTKRRTYERLV